MTAIPSVCDTAACLLNVARYFVHTEGLSAECALYLAEHILGIADSSDPSGIRSRVLSTLHEARP